MKNQHTCSTCCATLPAYFAVLSPPQNVCTLCCALGPYQSKETRNGTQTVQEQRRVLDTSEQLGPVSERLDVPRIVARIVAWATRHDDHWPRVRDFAFSESGLPPLKAVRATWGSVIEMRAALHAAYPHFQGRRVRDWTPANINEAVSAWMARHPYAPYEVPRTWDFRYDDALPSAGIMSRKFGGLPQFYAQFEAGRYVKQFEQGGHAARRKLRQTWV